MRFPHYRQADAKDCGPTCLKIIAKHYGKTLNIQTLRQLSETTREGSNLLNLSDAAESLGLRTLGVKLSLEKLMEAPLPCILHWNANHYVVLASLNPSKGGTFKRQFKAVVSDPAFGLIEYNQEEFLKRWIGNNADENTQEGIALLIEPTPKFLSPSDSYRNSEGGALYGIEKKNNHQFSSPLWGLGAYLLPYKSFVLQLIIGLLAGSILQLIFPFLTQSVVDVGIQNQNIHFIYMVLAAQLFLFFGKTALELIRSWIILHLSTRINISLISDFFIKLMNLPISYFDVRMTGDIMQRINDHHRIERILTTSSLSVLFSVINMFIMGGVLAYYNLKIFAVFFVGSFLYFLWVILFLKRREVLDYKRFSEVSQEQSKVIELINGMQEIKLHNAEKQKRWGWEYIQARLFKVSMKSLVLEQTQGIGSNFINELKNIIIIFLSAKLVIDGQITLGMMMAITSIVGGLNGPIMQLIGFIREWQDAKISLARLSEIHEKEDETQNDTEKSHDTPENCDVVIKDLDFRYIGSDVNVLENLNLVIPANKITAIVGTSGSGKTTLMKLLLKFYEPNKGEIILSPSPSPKERGAETGTLNASENIVLDNSNALRQDDFAPSLWEGRGGLGLGIISQKAWRNHIGSVMQEGFIFNDTIANNIAIGQDVIDKERLQYAADVANIKEFIETYPLRYNTKIGQEGVGMSTGQKQRLLIARAVYKNPEMLFFDEATSALDANNEKDYIAYDLNRDLQPYSVEKTAQGLETNQLKERLLLMQQQYQISQNELQLKKQELERFKKLYDKGVIATQEWESKNLDFLQSEKNVRNIGAQLSQMRSSTNDLKRNSGNTVINESKDNINLLRNVLQSFTQLKKAINDWELQYVLQSSIKGEVSFMQIWVENQTINAGEQVFTIVPTDTKNYIAKVKAPAQNSGKIKVNQDVNIRLANYPDGEFGIIKGKIKSISLTPDKEGNLLIDVSLPNGIATSYDKKIIFRQEMSGTADIITEDLRLIERLLYQFRDIFRR